MYQNFSEANRCCVYLPQMTRRIQVEIILSLLLTSTVHGLAFYFVDKASWESPTAQAYLADSSCSNCALAWSSPCCLAWHWKDCILAALMTLEAYVGGMTLALRPEMRGRTFLCALSKQPQQTLWLRR